MRPSERVPGDYALAFRTRTEIRHWKIVKRDGNYYVHPRPNPYPTVPAIVQVDVTDLSLIKMYFVFLSILEMQLEQRQVL